MSFLLSISMTSNFSGSILYLASTCYFALQIIVICVVHICIQRIVCILSVDSFISMTLTMNHLPPKAVKKGPQIKENEKKHDMYHDDLVLFQLFLDTNLVLILFLIQGTCFAFLQKGQQLFEMTSTGFDLIRSSISAFTLEADILLLDTFSKQNLIRGQDL